MFYFLWAVLLVIILTLLGTLLWGKKDGYQKKWFLSTTDLYYSDDPTEWTVTSHPNFTVAVAGEVIRFKGKYICRVAGDTSDSFRNFLMYSSDGITWSQIVFDGRLGDISMSLAHNDNVAVFTLLSDNNTVFYSSDGINWNESTSTFPTDLDEGQIVYNNGLFHIYGVSDDYPTGLVYYSSNGDVWSEINSSVLTNLTPIRISYGENLWVMMVQEKFLLSGEAGDSIVTSTDGKTWTNQNVEIFNRSINLGYGNGRWVAQGNISNNDSYFYYSDDGENWTISTFDSGAGGSVQFNSNSLKYYPTVGLWISGNYIYNDTSNLITYSRDGENWSLANLPSDPFVTGNQINDIAYGEGKFIAVGETALNEPLLYQSTDGINWEDVPNDFDNDLYLINYL